MVRGRLFARADALIPASGGYVLQETKAATYPDKLPGHLLDDIAIQLWVIAGTGLPVARAELNLLDGRWRYPGGGDYRGLFRPWVMDGTIAARIDEVPRWLEAAERVLAGAMPEIRTGRQCENPHPCPFYDHCLPLDPPRPEHPIELLPGRAGKALAQRLRTTRGYVSLLEPAPEEFTGKDAALYRRMQRAHRTGGAVLEAGSGAAFAALPWPRYYLDFEGIDLPVPRWAGVRPYEQVPFQWSCHIEHGRAEFEHREFLDLTGEDPSIGCIESLLRAIPPEGAGPVFVYSQTYEAGRLKELAERHPAHARALERLLDRLVDLLPLVREHYYHPAMRGSFSIKRVLPTIAPDLDFETLEGVSDGTEAQAAYLSAALDAATTPERKAQLRESLRRYCRRDTWAMVEVAHHLQRLERPATA